MKNPGFARVSALTLTCMAVFYATPAWAERLELAADASWWAHAFAALLLILHIAGGAVGLAAGTAASLTTKGGRWHRCAGRWFAVGMFISYLIGAGVAPFLQTGQRPNFIGGVLALYLLLTGVAAARRREICAGPQVVAGLAAALFITAMGLWFAYQGAHHPSGTVDGSPPQAFVIFVLAGSAAAAGELNVLLRGKLEPAARVSRHLWRMCVSFFIASGSLFLGQPQVFPGWFNNSPLPLLLAFAPLLVMVVWMIKVRRGRRSSGAESGSKSGSESGSGSGRSRRTADSAAPKLSAGHH